MSPIDFRDPLAAKPDIQRPGEPVQLREGLEYVMVAIFQRFVCGRRLVEIETEPSVEVEKRAITQKRTDIRPR
jgi:hypothetical protein